MINNSTFLNQKLIFYISHFHAKCSADISKSGFQWEALVLKQYKSWLLDLQGSKCQLNQIRDFMPVGIVRRSLNNVID
jgi:hypothetical protein